MQARLDPACLVFIDETWIKTNLQQVVDELRIRLPEEVITVRFDINAPVGCDAQRVGQLASNLLGNAITYGSADRPILIEAATTMGMFELSVTNAGEAIPPEVMERIFRPFSRGAVRPSMQGLGLGLYISHEIATAHGGTLDVRSTSDETQFTFRMPIS